MDVLLKISIALVVGIIGGKLAERFKLPNVSGYLIFGLLLGPSITGLFSSIDEINKFNIISEIALAIIAFSIGSEFIIKEIKKLGKSIVIITLLEVVGAIGVVFSVMYFGFKQDFAFSIVIASMSAATAPAATLLVMRQFRAHGPLTKTILPVVALDDIFGIIAFGIAMSVALISQTTESITLGKMIMGPFIEIGGSILLGLILGFALALVVRLLKSHGGLQPIVLATIGLATGLSKVLGFSPLLTNIVIGTVIVNVVHNYDKVFNSVNDFAGPIYVLFFTLAGAKLELSVLAQVGWLGLGYIIARASGKMIGAAIGAQLVNADKVVKRYLGLALLPQGGISIGLLVIVAQNFQADFVQKITTIIMFSVLIYETSGPIFAKIAIKRAGEINGLDRLEDPSILVPNMETN